MVNTDSTEKEKLTLRQKQKLRQKQRKRKPFPLTQRLREFLSHYDMRRFLRYRTAYLSKLLEEPILCELLQIPPQATPLQIATRLHKNPEFMANFRMFKSGNEYFFGFNYPNSVLVLRPILNYGASYKSLLKGLPISKLELDRRLLELKNAGVIFYGGGNGNNRWYWNLPRQDGKPDLWKFTLDFFKANPQANRNELAGAVHKEYPDTNRLTDTMNRVVAMLCTQGKLKADHGRWIVLDDSQS